MSRTEHLFVIEHCVHVGMTPIATHMFVYMTKLKPNYSMVLVFRLQNKHVLSDDCYDIGDCKRNAMPKIVTENAMK